MTTTNDKKRKFDKNFNFFLVIFFMPDSELNFIIKLRHKTTYLESGVTAARVEISKFLTFLTRSFFQATNTNKSVKSDHLLSFLPYTNDWKVLSHVWKLTLKHCFQGRDVNLCKQDVYISAKLSVVLKLFPIFVGNTEFSDKEPEPSNKYLSE